MAHAGVSLKILEKPSRRFKKGRSSIIENKSHPDRPLNNPPSTEYLIVEQKNLHGTLQHKERRKHKRFPVRGDAFVMLKPQSEILGKIIEVSRGGLSFRYVPNGRFVPFNHHRQTLHILLADHSFNFDSFPCKIISDWEISDYEFGFTLLSTRRQGVQFTDLSDECVKQLEYFFRNHTVEKEKCFGELN